MVKKVKAAKHTRRPAPAVVPPVKGVVHLAIPPKTIPVVVHDPVRQIVSVAHVEPDKVGWLKWLFGPSSSR